MYWQIHALGILILYELFIHLGLSPMVRANLMELSPWIAFFIHFFGWFGTLFVSIGVGITFFIPVWQTINGIKTPIEGALDKRSARQWEKAHGGKVIMKNIGALPYIPKDKMAMYPNSWILARIAFEGFTFGALAFVLLRYPTFYLTGHITDWNFAPYQNGVVGYLDIGWWHYLAVALGTGLYLELIFRRWLFNLILDQIHRLAITMPEKGPLSVISWFISFIPSQTIRWSGGIINFFRIFVAAVLGSLVYSFVFLMILDAPGIYTLVGHFVFGMAMTLVYLWRGLGVVIWCHVWYNLFYFMVM
jgi:hypothetical protein